MALFVLSLCPFDISVGVGAFVIGLSQISSFFSCLKPLTLYTSKYSIILVIGLILLTNLRTFKLTYAGDDVKKFYHIKKPSYLGRRLRDTV